MIKPWTYDLMRFGHVDGGEWRVYEPRWWQLNRWLLLLRWWWRREQTGLTTIVVHCATVKTLGAGVATRVRIVRAECIK